MNKYVKLCILIYLKISKPNKQNNLKLLNQL